MACCRLYFEELFLMCRDAAFVVVSYCRQKAAILKRPSVNYCRCYSFIQKEVMKVDILLVCGLPSRKSQYALYSIRESLRLT